MTVPTPEMIELTKELAEELLSYNPESGELRWKTRDIRFFSSDAYMRRWNTRLAGKLAGVVNPDGYIEIRLSGTIYKAHRLIWFMQAGSWPDGQIDHVDHCRTNNRWSNLRSVTNADNSRNQSRHSSNTSGVTGVSWDNRYGRWRATIKVDGTKKHLGYFVNFNEAVAVRKLAESEYGFHENHGRAAA